MTAKGLVGKRCQVEVRLTERMSATGLSASRRGLLSYPTAPSQAQLRVSSALETVDGMESEEAKKQKSSACAWVCDCLRSNVAVWLFA